MTEIVFVQTNEEPLTYKATTKGPYRREGDRVAVQKDCTGGRTDESQQDACDVNNILRRYTATGQISHLSGQNPLYGDFSNVDDYLTAVSNVQAAKAAFLDLPSAIRNRFKNDPAELIGFLEEAQNDEAVYAEAVELGLVTAPNEEGITDPPEPIDGGQPEPPEGA